MRPCRERSISTPTWARRSPTTPACWRVVTSANVACGFHAGTRATMQAVCAEAVRRGVALGAQVSYADRENFGRVALDVAPRLLADQVAEQVGTAVRDRPGRGRRGRLPQAARRALPPGRPSTRSRPRRCWPGRARCRCWACPGRCCWRWRTAGARLVRHEGFPDRAYADDGRLVPRDVPGALVTDPAEVAARAVELAAPRRLGLRARGQPGRGGAPPTPYAVRSRPRGSGDELLVLHSLRRHPVDQAASLLWSSGATSVEHPVGPRVCCAKPLRRGVPDGIELSLPRPLAGSGIESDEELHPASLLAARAR